MCMTVEEGYVDYVQVQCMSGACPVHVGCRSSAGPVHVGACPVHVRACFKKNMALFRPIGLFVDILAQKGICGNK